MTFRLSPGTVRLSPGTLRLFPGTVRLWPGGRDLTVIPRGFKVIPSNFLVIHRDFKAIPGNFKVSPRYFKVCLRYFGAIHLLLWTIECKPALRWSPWYNMCALCTCWITCEGWNLFHLDYPRNVPHLGLECPLSKPPHKVSLCGRCTWCPIVLNQEGLPHSFIVTQIVRNIMKPQAVTDYLISLHRLTNLCRWM